jgi:hypothetical protein
LIATFSTKFDKNEQRFSKDGLNTQWIQGLQKVANACILAPCLVLRHSM